MHAYSLQASLFAVKPSPDFHVAQDAPDVRTTRHAPDDNGEHICQHEDDNAQGDCCDQEFHTQQYNAQRPQVQYPGPYVLGCLAR